MTESWLPAARELVAWAKADGWRDGAHSIVALDGDRVVGTAICMPNLVHTIRLSLFVEATDEGVRATLVEHFRAMGLGPFAVKADRGTDEHAFWTSLGAFAYQVCPSQRVDCTSETARQWAADHAPASGIELVRGDQLELEELVQAVTNRYLWQHTSWSPMTSRDAVEGVMREEVTEGTDLVGSFAALRDGEITAICDLYTDDWGDTRVCCAEATDPSSPGARADVAAVMGAVMRHVAALADAAAGKPVLEFDGHVTDPHFAPLLRTIPGAFGPVCELLEVP